MNQLNVLTNFYREVIGPVMSDIYVELNPLIARILKGGKPGKISRSGEEVIFNQGGYYQGFSDARLRVGETGRTYSHTLRKGLVQPEMATMRWEAETEFLVYAKRDQGDKYEDYLTVLADRWVNGWKDSHTIDCYGDGTMNLGFVVNTGTAGPNTIQIAEPQVFRKLPQGMHIDVGLEADFVAGNDALIHRCVIVRQIDEFTFEVDNLGPIVPNMSIKRELRRNNQTYVPGTLSDTYVRTFHGLRSNMTTTGNLFGINRTDVNYRPITHNAALATGLIYDDLLDISTTAEHRGVTVQDFFLPLDQYNTLLKRITNDIRTNTRSEAFMKQDNGYREGISYVEFLISNRMTQLYTDVLLEGDKGYAITPSTWRAYQLANGILVYGNGEPDIVNFGEDITGRGMIYNPADPHSHAIECVFIGQYACVQPRHNVVIDFI